MHVLKNNVLSPDIGASVKRTSTETNISMQLGFRIDHPLDYQVDSEGGWVTPVVQVSCRGRDVVGPAYVGLYGSSVLV